MTIITRKTIHFVTGERIRPCLRILQGLFYVLLLIITAGCSKESRTQRSLEKAVKFEGAGNDEAARIEWLNALSLDPKNPEAWRRLALMYSRQGRWAMAAPTVVQAVKLAPQDLELRKWLGTLDLVTGQLEDAWIQANVILEQQPTNSEAILILIEASKQPGKAEALEAKLAGLRQQVGDHAAFHLAEASLKLRRGDLQAAETEARLAIKMDAKSDLARVVLGQVLAAQNRREDSEAAYLQGFELSPNDSLRRIQWPSYLLTQGRSAEAYPLLLSMSEQIPGALWVWGPLAKASLDLGKLDESEKWLKKVFEFEPRDVEARTLQGQLHLLRGHKEEAVRSFERLMQDHPNSAQINYQLALAYIAAGRMDGAVPTLKQVLKLNPQAVPPAFMLAELYIRQRDFDASGEILRGLNQRMPGDPRVLLLLAETSTQLGNLDDAVSIYRSILGKNPGDVGASFRLGQVLLLQGQRDEARVMFEAVVSKSPDFLPAITYLADLELRESDVSAALARLKKEVVQHPDSGAVRFLFGQARLASGDVSGAESEFMEVVRLVPDQPHGYLALASLYTSHAERLQDARKQLEAMRSNSTGKVQALLMLGLLDISEGDFTGAGDSYEEVLKSQPQNLIALTKLAFLEATHLGNPDRAVDLALVARQLAPQDPMVADTYGWALLQQGDCSAALQVLQEAVFSQPANPVILHHLGAACYIWGMEEVARKHLQAAMLLAKTYKYREDIQDYLDVLDVKPGASDPQTLALLMRTLEMRPADPVALNRLALVDTASGNQDKALKRYEAAHQANPKSFPVVLWLANAYSKITNKAEEAMRHAKTARVMAPLDPDVSHLLGRLAFRSGDHKWALSLFQESESKRPGNPEVSFDLALAYFSVGRLVDSKSVLDLGVTGTPLANRSDVRGFQTMLALQMDLQNTVNARQIAEEALRADPADVPARMVLGLTAEKVQDYRLAGESYEAVLKVYPEFTPAMKRLMNLAANYKRDDQVAYEYGIKARDAVESDPELAGDFGRIVYRRSDYGYAAQLLQERLKKTPDDAETLYYLGLAQTKLELREEARSSLSKALDLDAKHPLAAEAKDALRK